MARLVTAARAATLLRIPVFRRSFATGTIEEHQLNEEMKKLMGGDCSGSKNKKKSVIKTFKYPENGKWLVGSNVYLVDGDDENTDNIRPTGGIRYVIDKDGVVLGVKAFVDPNDEGAAKLGVNWQDANIV